MASTMLKNDPDRLPIWKSDQDGIRLLSDLLQPEPQLLVHFRQYSESVLSANLLSLPTESLLQIRLAIARSEFVNELKSEYESIVSRRLLGLQTRMESFNVWLMERLLYRKDSGEEQDPLLPSSSASSVDPSPYLSRILLSDIPVRVPKRRLIQDPFQTLDAFKCKVREYLLVFPSSSSSTEMVGDDHHSEKGIVLDALQKSEGEDIDCEACCYETLIRFQKAVRPVLQSLMRNEVSLCSTELEGCSLARVRLLCELREQLQQQLPQLSIPGSLSHPVQLVREQEEEGKGTGFCVITNSAREFRLLEFVFRKLEFLYRGRKDLFLDCVFLMLLRYDDFCGVAGAGYQAAVPPSATRVLVKSLGVSMECFASPLNCYFSDFCSAFVDTDAVFGSVGDFFSFWPVEGSFTANPPFVAELIGRMTLRLNKLLRISEEVHDLPLSFVLALPNWERSETDFRREVTAEVRQSPYLQKYVVVKRNDHSYALTLPEQCVMTYRYSETGIAFLQNAKGAAKWPVNDDVVREFVAMFQFVQE